MKKAKLFYFIVLIFTIICCAACNKEDQGTDNPSYGVVTDEEAHYLVFVVEDVEIAKMVVVSTDTYDALEEYFPTIPEKDGFNAYWEEKEVYSESQVEVYINAYYVKSKSE